MQNHAKVFFVKSIYSVQGFSFFEAGPRSVITKHKLIAVESVILYSLLVYYFY